MEGLQVYFAAAANCESHHRQLAARGRRCGHGPTGDARMIMNRKQQVATAFLAVLIVASVMAMPRAPLDAPHENRAVRTSGIIAVAPTPAAELAHDQVKDLTYN